MPVVITILEMVDVHTTPSSILVWIVPGTIECFDDNYEGEFSGLHITEYLPKRGVYIGRYFGESETKKIVEDIKGKFEREGIAVVLEVTAND